MRLIDKLERKFSRFGIKNLMMYIVFLMGVVFALSLIDGTLYYKLALIPSEVMKGQVWRLVTFVFIPPASSLFFMIFALMFYYFMGIALEREWGTFKFNLYYILGMIFTIAASFILKLAFNINIPAYSHYLNLSILLAFANIYPDYQIRIYFIIPIKMKYLAWILLAFYAFSLIMYPLPYKFFVIAALLNYFVFFGRDTFSKTKNRSSAYIRKQAFQRSVYVDRDKPFHRCEVCGRTELDDRELEFRICATCEGKHEYCMEHLLNHEHIKDEAK